jgi:hypothetical protein
VDILETGASHEVFPERPRDHDAGAGCFVCGECAVLARHEHLGAGRRGRGRAYVLDEPLDIGVEPAGRQEAGRVEGQDPDSLVVVHGAGAAEAGAAWRSDQSLSNPDELATSRGL